MIFFNFVFFTFSSFQDFFNETYNVINENEHRVFPLELNYYLKNILYESFIMTPVVFTSYKKVDLLIEETTFFQCTSYSCGAICFDCFKNSNAINYKVCAVNCYTYHTGKNKYGYFSIDVNNKVQISLLSMHKCAPDFSMGALDDGIRLLGGICDFSQNNFSKNCIDRHLPTLSFDYNYGITIKFLNIIDVRGLGNHIIAFTNRYNALENLTYSNFIRNECKDNGLFYSYGVFRVENSIFLNNYNYLFQQYSAHLTIYKCWIRHPINLYISGQAPTFQLLTHTNVETATFIISDYQTHLCKFNLIHENTPCQTLPSNCSYSFNAEQMNLTKEILNIFNFLIIYLII